MKYFQIILIVIFVVGLALGVAIFAGFIKVGKDSGANKIKGNITVWGAVPHAVMAQINEAFFRDESLKMY